MPQEAFIIDELAAHIAEVGSAVEREAGKSAVGVGAFQNLPDGVR